MHAAHNDTLHRELQSLVKTLKSCELRLARKLAEMQVSGEFRRYASSMQGYMRDWLKVESAEKPRKLLKIGLALPTLPVLTAAMEDQSLGWTKAFEVTRIATPETEESWVAKAKEWPVPTLRAEVASASLGDDAPDEPEQADTVVVRIEMTVAQRERFRRAVGLARSLSPKDAPDLSDAEVLELLAECFTTQTAKREHEISPSRFKTVTRQCVTCGTNELAGLPEGHHVVVDEVEHAMACCDGQFIDLSPGQEGHAYKTVTDTLRRQVYERANYRCQTPGCDHWLHLDLHHARAREDGGPHAFANVVLVCGACHRRAHGGLLFIEPAGRGSFSFRWASTVRRQASSDREKVGRTCHPVSHSPSHSLSHSLSHSTQCRRP